MNSLAIFCGARIGNRASYQECAVSVGHELARRGIRIIYGGGSVGLMGLVAKSALSLGGDVVGVIPKALATEEMAFSGLTDLIVVDTLQERKKTIADLADGFLALPGGGGTLDEIIEQWTWAQLGIHQKPCGFLDVDGYFALLKDTLEWSCSEGFTERRHVDMLIFSNCIEHVLAEFSKYEPPRPRWPD